MWFCKECGGEIVGIVKTELEESYSVNEKGDIEEAKDTRNETTNLENFECEKCGKYIYFDNLREEAEWKD